VVGNNRRYNPPKPRRGESHAHTFANLLTRVIFSAKDRQPLIAPELRPNLLAYPGGIARELQGKAITANSMPDHVHILLCLPPSVAVADALRALKTNSSPRVHGRWSQHQRFARQPGYGAFSVSQSNAAAVVKYTREQEKHHRRLSFQEEFIIFLKRNRIEYDERYIWE
jgi:REP-associated tyrosine transposase